MDNIAIADIFDEIADILDIEGVDWKPRAYRNAALSIRNHSKPLSEIYKESGIKGIKEIPGIGENIAKKIEEIMTTGKLEYLNKVRKEIPSVIVELMQLSHVGPKTAKKIYDKLKIKNMDDLKKRIKEGKLHNLKGFGEKLEHEILDSIEEKEKQERRYLLSEALPIAEDIKKRILKQKNVSRVMIAGSIARMKESIGDIDILVESKKSNSIMDHFTKMDIVKRLLSKGETRSSVVLSNGMQVDLRIVEGKSFGAATQYFVGSKEHNVKMRQIAIKKGCKLSEYGLFKGEKQIAGRDEKAVYNELGMQWIPFELREESGEIEAAQRKKLPKLVEPRDIKGDLHCHTSYVKLSDMVRAANKIGHEYLAITDHTPNSYGHNMHEKARRKQMNDIDKINKKSRCFILKGIEADISDEGELECSDSLLKDLDIVIASIHDKLNGKDITKRVLKAMDNRYVNIIAHPTKRYVLEKKEATIDIEKVIDKARERGIILEINSKPRRLDLNDIDSRAAVQKGVKLAVNSDAHHIEELEWMKYGVAVARRAWCEKKDIINTMKWNKVEKVLRR